MKQIKQFFFWGGGGESPTLSFLDCYLEIKLSEN